MKRAAFLTLLLIVFLSGCTNQRLADTKLYTDEARGYSFTIPAGWAVEKGELGEILSPLYIGTDSIAITTTLTDVNSTEDFKKNGFDEEYAVGYTRGFRQKPLQGEQENFVLLNSTPLIIGGKNSYLLEFRFSYKGRAVVVRDVFIEKYRNRVYSITLIYETDNSKAYDKEFEEIITSFEFLPSQPTPSQSSDTLPAS